MTPLLDVNVLVALAWPTHVHHGAAHRWFAAQNEWATCPLTQSGFVRVSSNPKVVGTAPGIGAVCRVLSELCALKAHEFWVDPVDLRGNATFTMLRLVGYRQVTDAHLLSLAVSRGGRLATLDRGVLELLPARLAAEDTVELIAT